MDLTHFITRFLSMQTFPGELFQIGELQIKVISETVLQFSYCGYITEWDFNDCAALQLILPSDSVL
jgi:hypothetical protein